MAKTKQAKKSVQSRSTCQHRWVLETPNGPTVTGRCRKCERERSFQTVPAELRLFRPMVSSGSRGDSAKSSSVSNLDAA